MIINDQLLTQEMRQNIRSVTSYKKGRDIKKRGGDLNNKKKKKILIRPSKNP